MTTYTSEEVLAKINAARNKLDTSLIRENYTSRENEQNSFFLQKPREECKNKKIKKEKHISRDSHEESHLIRPSDPIESASQGVSPEGLEGQLSQEEEVLEIAEGENYTSRSYTGIEAFHNKTPKGIKLNLAFQTAEDAELGACVKLTGELKRQDRFRELGEYAGDEEYFKEFVNEVKKFYQKDKTSDWCMGRVHARGKRDAWFANIIVVGKLVDSKITEVMIWIESEKYEFNLDLALNSNQQEFYHSGGRFGSIKSIKKVPSLRTAERVLYK
jgi:hypothetical protein